MRLESAVISDMGKVRDNNEDSFFLDGIIPDQTEINNTIYISNAKRDWHAFAVCDGMGGESCGEVASQIGVQTLAELCGPELEKHLAEYIDIANQRVCSIMSDRHLRRMGSTVALLYLKNTIASICNLGDSRIYLYDENMLFQLSEDHRIKSAAGKTGVLTQHLGVLPDEFVLEPHIVRDILLKPGMIFLLCSDGLTDMVSNQELSDILSVYKQTTVKEIADRLIDSALKHGGKDNVTVMVVKVLEKE